VMSEHLYSVAPDADVSDAATIMMEKHVNPLPVVDGSKFVGMISRSDIVRLMVLEEDKATGRLVPAE
jgi:CBS domain-containing protein